jgi:hypothetical protein
MNGRGMSGFEDQQEENEYLNTEVADARATGSPAEISVVS